MQNILQQWRDAKQKHPEMMMLFRMGDFYEFFGEDADAASKILGLTLMQRNTLLPRSEATVSMTGFPHHQLETYLRKLLAASKRVAICEQVKE